MKPAAPSSSAAIQNKANNVAAQTRNSAGFGSVLDAAARSRQQAAAGASEGIAAQNAQLQQKNQQSAASGLQGLYGTDVDATMKALGLQDQAINTETQAGQSGWLQNATGILGALNGAGTAAAIKAKWGG